MTIKKISMCEHRKAIEDKLKSNDNYCPCSLTKSEDTKCMCKNFRDKIERREAGKCHCGLYEIIIDD